MALDKNNTWVPDFICPICIEKKVKTSSFKGLSYHFKNTHSLDLFDWIVEKYKIEFPKCIHCKKTISYSGRVRQYLLTDSSQLRYCSNNCKRKDDEYRRYMSEAGTKGGLMTKGRQQSEVEKLQRANSAKEFYKAHPEAVKVKSEFMKNRIVSSETRAKLSKVLNGRKFTAERKKQMSETVTKMWLDNKFKFKRILFHSYKNNKDFYLMSSWEIKFALVLELNDDVLAYENQSFSINYIDENHEQRKYIPDFKVFYKERKTAIYEIGVKKIKNNKRNTAKSLAAKEYCSEYDYEYFIYDYDDINEYIKNANITNYFMQLNSEIEGELLSQIILLKQPFDKIKIINTVNYIQGTIQYPDVNKTNLYTSEFKSQYRDFLIEFFPHFYDCKRSDARFTPNDCLQNKIPLRHIISEIGKSKSFFSWNTFTQQIRKEQYGISWFRPSIAKFVYKRFINTNNPSVLDPCGGFGARLLAFYDSFIDSGKYTYVDAWHLNVISAEALSKSIRAKNIVFHNAYFEELMFDEKFDLIYTSIPFGKIEQYSDVLDRYNSFDDWKEKFLFIFLNKSIDLLNTNGKLILSCNQQILDIINTKYRILDKIEINSHSNYLTKQIAKKEYVIQITH
jgi:hypothetical protein